MQINWVFQSKSRHLVEWVKEHNPTICCLQGTYFRNFPGGTVDKNPPANAEDLGLTPSSRRYPREGNGNSFQYSCLENSRNRGGYSPRGCKELDTT